MEDFGKKKIRFKKGYFYVGEKLYHRIIWERANGIIPAGHVIHHKNGDKLNNSLENLECLSREDHSRLHRLCESKALSDRMKANSENLHEWHRSEEGKKSLSEKAAKQFEAREVRICICAECGKEFPSKHTVPTLFCSGNCMSKDRRKSGKDNEERICAICSKPFTINKYQKTKTCSFICRNLLISRLKSK